MVILKGRYYSVPMLYEQAEILRLANCISRDKQHNTLYHCYDPRDIDFIDEVLMNWENNRWQFRRDAQGLVRNGYTDNIPF